jgi:methylmalonyl-CoA/ethylmalonyl-CoA epimerase
MGYVVADMTRGIRRFVAEGAEVVIEPTADPLQRVSCCLLRCDGAVDIELVAPLVPGDSPVESRLRRGGGLDHICYATDDLASALEREESSGSLVVCPPVFAVTFGRDIAFVQRRSGLVVEFMADPPAAVEGERR